jgi:hypothetical protein
MTICYTPHTTHNTTSWPTFARKLANNDAYIYIEKHIGQDHCRFQYQAATNDWCVRLGLATNDTDATNENDACGTRVAYLNVSNNTYLTNYINYLSALKSCN